MKHPILFYLFFFATLTQSIFGAKAFGAKMLDLSLIDPALLNGALPQNVVDQLLKTVAIYTVHRPYSGATSIVSSNSIDVNAEVTLVKLGNGLVDALQSSGLQSPNVALPAFPIAKLHIRKGFTKGFDLGFSGLAYRNNTIYGGDLKFVIHDPEEGPSYAFRFGYTYAKIPVAYIKNCSTFSPEVVVSRRLTFAEPYLGLGGRYFTGKVEVPFPAVAPVPAFTISKAGKGTTAYAFTGIYFRILGPQGLRLGIEGSYDISGFSTIGGVFGLGF